MCFCVCIDINSTVSKNIVRVPILNETLNSLQPRVAPIINRTSILLSQSGLRDEALDILNAAQEAHNRTIETEQRVSITEEGLVDVASNLEGLVENVRIGENALDNAENKCKCMVNIMLALLFLTALIVCMY